MKDNFLSCPRLDGMGAADVQSEDDQTTDSEHDPPYWQQLVGREVLAGLRPQEIKRQEVINGEALSYHITQYGNLLKSDLLLNKSLSVCLKLLLCYVM